MRLLHLATLRVVEHNAPVDRFVTLYLSATRELVEEFTSLVTARFSDASVSVPNWRVGCDIASVMASVPSSEATESGAESILRVILEWNEKYPAFGLTLSSMP